MERLTKIVVLGWLGAALALEIWVLGGSLPDVPWLSAGAALLMAVLVAFDRRAVALVLLFSYFFPVLFRYWFGGPHYSPHEAVWMAALAGAMLPDAIRTRWHIPVPWRATLVAAALVVVVVSPILVLREIDLNPGLLVDRGAWNWYGSTWPSLAVTWILHTSLTLVIGVMWFDWLCGAPDLDFHGAVLTPLLVSAGVLSLVSLYQWFVDPAFLDNTVFAVLGRATGTMDDANVSGTIGAMWVGGAFLWAKRVGVQRIPLTVLVVALAWSAVWTSGSRTAFAAALCVTACIGVALVKEQRLARTPLLRVAGGAVAAVLALLLLVAVVKPTTGPFARLRQALPGQSASPVDFVKEMWNRNGYGTAATAMIKERPLFGIGIGTYQLMASDYQPGLSPDNAQNWLRHQIVESGLVGSSPWLLWFVLFGVFVLRARRSDPPGAWVTRGAILAFAAISLLGMPGQDVMVAVTFWTLAYWHITMVGPPADRAVPAFAWAAAILVPLVAAGGTAGLATTLLRPVARAQRTASPYTYGFSAPESGGSIAGYRSTRMHAVTVLDPTSRWLAVSVRLDDRMAGEPLDVRVWTDGETLLKGRLSDAAPLTAVVELPAQPGRVLLELSARDAASRLPAFVRGEDRRLLFKWEFLDRPPAHFNGYTRSVAG